MRPNTVFCSGGTGLLWAELKIYSKRLCSSLCHFPTSPMFPPYDKIKRI
jgi:hypothetical protein